MLLAAAMQGTAPEAVIGNPRKGPPDPVRNPTAMFSPIIRTHARRRNAPREAPV